MRHYDNMHDVTIQLSDMLNMTVYVAYSIAHTT